MTPSFPLPLLLLLLVFVGTLGGVTAASQSHLTPSEWAQQVKETFNLLSFASIHGNLLLLLLPLLLLLLTQFGPKSETCFSPIFF